MADRERVVLGFAAANGVVLARQLTGLLREGEPEVDELLADLTGAGLVARDRVGSAGADCFRITPAGLQAMGHRADGTRFAADHRHAVGAAWLWLAAQAEMFGPTNRVISEREMRASDQEAGSGSPFAVEPHEFGGRFEVHYPDLMLIRGAERMAIEFLLVLPPVSQLEAVLRAYAADVRIAHVVFATLDPRLGRVVLGVARSLELLPMAHVRLVSPY